MQPVLGTNPLAFGRPGPKDRPFIFDFATSAAARGEIELKQRAGEPIPPDWAVGQDGAPTIDPAAALAGAPLPFGGQKGSDGICVSGALLADLKALAAVT